MDLDAFINQCVAHHRREKEKNKKSSPKPPEKTPEELALEDFRRRHQLDLQWKREALVLFITRITCQHCGKTYEIPNEKILVKKTHKTLGVHYQIPTDAAQILSVLPKEIQYTERTAAHCGECFIPAQSPAQMSLILIGGGKK